MKPFTMNPRLFGTVVSLETRKLMSYRADFWLNTTVAFVIELTVAYFLWRAIFGANSQDTEAVPTTIGGFTFEGMMVYYVVALLLGRLVRGQERGDAMSLDIYDGGLTRYLIYPSSYIAFKYAGHLGQLLPAMIQLVGFGVVATFWLELPVNVTITPAAIAMTMGSVAIANLLAFLLRYPLAAVAFWADNVWALHAMLRFVGTLLGGLMIPLSLFPGWVQDVLHWLPFAHLFYEPVQTLLGQRDVGQWLQGMSIAAGWCLVLAALGGVVWRRGYLRYSGVGI